MYIEYRDQGTMIRRPDPEKVVCFWQQVGEAVALDAGRSCCATRIRVSQALRSHLHFTLPNTKPSSSIATLALSTWISSTRHKAVLLLISQHPSERSSSARTIDHRFRTRQLYRHTWSRKDRNRDFTYGSGQL